MLFMFSLFEVATTFLLWERQGRLFLAAQAAAFALNCFILGPIFATLLRLPLWALSIAVCLSVGLPGAVLTVIIFAGKFSIAPTLSSFIRPLSADFLHTLPAGLIDLFVFAATAAGAAAFCRCLAPTVEVAAIVTAAACVRRVVWAVTAAIAAAAVHAGRRAMKVVGAGAAIACVQQVVMSMVMIWCPSAVAGIWVSPGMVCDEVVPTLFMSCGIAALVEIGLGLLNVVQSNTAIVAVEVGRAVVMTAAAAVLARSAGGGPATISQAVPATEFVMFAAVCICVAAPLKRLWTSRDE
jgi:hypothetical protein